MLAEMLFSGPAGFGLQSIAAHPRLIDLSSSKQYSKVGSASLGYTASRLAKTRSFLPVFGFTATGSKYGFLITRGSGACLV